MRTLMLGPPSWSRPSAWGQPACLLLAAAATTALFWATDLDLRVSALFHLPGAPGGSWPDADRPIVVALHRMTPWLAGALGATGVALMVAGRLRARWRALTAEGILIVLALLLGPGLVVNALVKDHARRPRPHRTMAFGGDHRYVPPLAPGPHGRSFPCGDASVGFAIGVLGCVLRRRRPAAARLAVGAAVLVGLATGAARVAAGAHFVSDVLWSGFLVWGTILALDRALSRFRERGTIGDAPGFGAAAGPGAAADHGIAGKTRRRAVAWAIGGAALAVATVAVMPFEQVVDRSWAPAPAAGTAGTGDAAPTTAAWRIDLRLEAGSARVIFEPGGRLAGQGGAPGPALSLHGRLNGFGAPWARVLSDIEARSDRRLVDVSIRRRGWFADLGGTTEVRIAAAMAAEVDIEVTDGALTLVAAPGIVPPVVTTRTRPDALRLRGVRPDQVRTAELRTELGRP